MQTMRDRLKRLIQKEVPRPKADSLVNSILADGWIRPPCKVGDKVFIIEKEYRLNKVEHKIITCEIEFIYVSSKTKRYHTKKLECPYMDNGFNFRPKDIGKTVFLTKEEAETELRKRSEYNA